MFHFHKWSDWIIEERGKLVDMFNKKLGSYVTQSRYCLKEGCGKIQIETTQTISRQDLNQVPEATTKKPKHDKVS